MATYKTIGVNEVINGAGTLTVVGGCLMAPRVLEAMNQAAASYVEIEKLLVQSGEYLANLLDVPGALIVNGAYTGMVVAISACLARDDIFTVRNLPQVAPDLKNEVIVLKSQRNLFDQAIRQTGARIKEVGLSDFSFHWELEKAWSDKTCAVVYYPGLAERPGSLPLLKVIEIAQQRQIPVIVDAAAELPPMENLWNYHRAGADLVIISGGKDLRGPQTSGLIVGRKEMIDLCRLSAHPNYCVARSGKVGKEEIMGLVTAVELYLKEDHTRRYLVWEEQVAVLLEMLQKHPELKARRVFPGQDYIRPALIPRLYFELPPKCGWSGLTFASALAKQKPGIIIANQGTTLIFNPHMSKKGQEKIVGEKILELYEHGPKEVQKI